MYRPRVIPCLLLQGEGLVKTTNFKNPIYIGDPMNAIRIFNDFQADEIVLLDITATREKRCISHDFVQEVSEEAFVPFAVGGGISTLEDVRAMFARGADKVIINTAALQNPSLVTQAANIFGSQSIVVSLDVKREGNKNTVFHTNATQNTNEDVVSLAKYMESAGAGELIITSVDAEGTMAGYNLELYRQVASAVRIPIIASGGAGTLEDLKPAIDAGASAVAAGSLFVYSGKNKGILINYPDHEELLEALAQS